MEFLLLILKIRDFVWSEELFNDVVEKYCEKM